MKMLLNVRFPIEPFNTLVREGTVGKVLDAILKDIPDIDQTNSKNFHLIRSIITH